MHDQRRRPIRVNDSSQWAGSRRQELGRVGDDHEVGLRHDVGFSDAFQQLRFDEHGSRPRRSRGVRQ